MSERKKNPSELIAQDIPLEQVPWADTKSAAETLSRAFADNPVMRVMENAARNANRAIHENFTGIIARARTNGIAMRTSIQHEGVAVWYLTGFTRSNLLMDLHLALYKIRSFRIREIGRLLPFYIQVEKAHVRIIKQPHYYLELLGVDPQYQGQGFASKLLRPVLAHADAHRKKCYLETQSEENVSMYMHFGFEVADKIPVYFSDIPYRLMLRKPQGTSSYFFG